MDRSEKAGHFDQQDGDPEGWWEGPPAFDPHDSGPGGPRRAQARLGADLRGRLPTGVIRLPAQEVSA